MIVMKAISVFVRTASVTGCKTCVARPDSIACAVEGESASAVAMLTTCWRAAESPSRRASSRASTLPTSTTTAITAICRAIACPANERGHHLRITPPDCDPVPAQAGEVGDQSHYRLARRERGRNPAPIPPDESPDDAIAQMGDAGGLEHADEFERGSACLETL